MISFLLRLKLIDVLSHEDLKLIHALYKPSKRPSEEECDSLEDQRNGRASSGGTARITER